MSKIQLRRGTSGQWTAANPVLAIGELGFEIDTRKLKAGDGTTVWNTLPYVSLDWDTLSGKPTYIAAGATTADARNAIGLDQVDNTSDADKPISDATQMALDGKSDTSHGHVTSDVSGLDTALASLEPTITAGTTGQYYRGDKSWQTLDKSAVGLSNVDDTSDATKNSASVTLTNKSISGSSNTLSNIPQSAVTDLTADLAMLDATASTALATAQAAESASNKGQAGGYASLDGGGKVPVSQLPNSIMEYQGTWNASTNSPTLVDGTGNTGDVYRVAVAGTQDLGSGSLAFGVSDYAIYNGVTWEKADTTDAVSSVNGYTGTVSLAKGDVGLDQVDNTSDATKNAASVTLTNKSISGSSNTLSNIPQSAVTNLSTDLSTAASNAMTALSNAASAQSTANTANTTANTALSTANIKEPAITAGTTSQYWRGDKSFQTLDKTSVGLANVDNTSDATKNSATATLTNKRITMRVGSTTSSATPTIDIDSYDQYNITALAAAITSVTISGTPTDGQKLLVRIKDNGSVRTLAWGSSFASSGTGTLLTTTVANKTHLSGFIYDSTAAKWVCVAADATGY